MAVTIKTANWPILNFADYGETLETVQLWAQIIGKIRLRNSPWINHSWHVTLYVNSRGFTTGSIPFCEGCFEIEFDFIDHQLQISSSTGNTQSIVLSSLSVADFYKKLTDTLQGMNIPSVIYAKPNEIDPAIPFVKDDKHKTYDPEAMNTLWQTFVRVNNVFKRFRAGYTGKCSPVHLFWGAFDLAVTRFSGREAPLHPGGAPNMPVRVMQEAYSHEVSSAGFWPGSKDAPNPVFYSYCYPTPAEFSKQNIELSGAFYDDTMGEFILPYQDVQRSPEPEKMLLSFLQITYVAAANTGNWDRKNLECDLTSYEH